MKIPLSSDRLHHYNTIRLASHSTTLWKPLSGDSSRYDTNSYKAMPFYINEVSLYSPLLRHHLQQAGFKFR
jgi:hypothetical protein